MKKDIKALSKQSNILTDEDIKQISENNKYNSRELYYIAVKSDWTKSQLELLSKYLMERDKIKDTNKIDVTSIGKEAIQLTTAEERKIVREHEKGLKKMQEREI